MLKKYKIFKTALLLSVMLFSACEKGSDLVSIESTVYIPNSGLSNQTALLGESIFKLGIYKAGNIHAPVTVTLDVDQEAFAEFILTNPGYELLPSSHYKIEKGEVVIKNEREDLNIKLTNINESFVNKKYILPIAIKSTSGGVLINEDKKVTFLHFSRFRNFYESKYQAYGEVVEENGEKIKIDEVLSPISVSANAIEINGPVTGMKVRLTVQNDEVVITGGAGSGVYNIQNNPNKSSTYIGEFDPLHQAFKGSFKLFYSYILNGSLQQASVDLSFTL